MKKLIVQIRVELYINMDEDSSLEQVMDELDYEFTDLTGTADIVGTEIKDYDVIDAR